MGDFLDIVIVLVCVFAAPWAVFRRASPAITAGIEPTAGFLVRTLLTAGLVTLTLNVYLTIRLLTSSPDVAFAHAQIVGEYIPSALLATGTLLALAMILRLIAPRVPEPERVIPEGEPAGFGF